MAFVFDSVTVNVLLPLTATGLVTKLLRMVVFTKLTVAVCVIVTPLLAAV